MISAVVFSKNRAAQLHLALHSIQKNFPDISDISVLYTYTDDEFKQGYEIAQEHFPSMDRVSWVEESQFKKDTMDILEKANSHMCFFTDDDIVYRKVFDSAEKICSVFDEYPDFATFNDGLRCSSEILYKTFQIIVIRAGLGAGAPRPWGLTSLVQLMDLSLIHI